MFVLQPASLPLLTQYTEEQTVAPGTLVAFVKYLAAQPQPLYAINLEFGVFRTHGLEHLKYAEAFLNFYQVRWRISPTASHCGAGCNAMRQVEMNRRRRRVVHAKTAAVYSMHPAAASSLPLCSLSERAHATRRLSIPL
jgi:hypothetical protein